MDLQEVGGGCGDWKELALQGHLGPSLWQDQSRPSA
jgi:hypothetical protein